MSKVSVGLLNILPTAPVIVMKLLNDSVMFGVKELSKIIFYSEINNTDICFK
jgi:hypothetical protein